MLIMSSWNQRFSAEEYIYGKEPNEFFKNELVKLQPGKLLLPAEGEGRNAVFAALLGWDVTAFDSSNRAKEKAERLAKEKKVDINYILSDYESIDFELNQFDCIVLVYFHLNKSERKHVHQKLLRFLKPKGSLILEGFSLQQINYSSGGPKNLDMLYSKEMLADDFNSLSNLEIHEKDVFLEEGSLHQGKASVVRVVGKK